MSCDWRSWEYSPPDWRFWRVIEWLRKDPDQYISDEDVQNAKVMNREECGRLEMAAWNIANVYWRPVM